jgi:hypothetical protein
MAVRATVQAVLAQIKPDLVVVVEPTQWAQFQTAGEAVTVW